MTDDVIHPEVHRLIQLFSALPEVTFPDVDTAMLHELIARAKERHLAVVQAEAALESARRALEDDQEQLLKKAHRLQAWLTVMAETDEGLQAKLVGISLPKQKRARTEVPVEGEPAPKKRGRPRKVSLTNDGLFGHGIELVDSHSTS